MLPDLDSDVDVEIVKENLNATQAIYFAYMLEQMRMFQVVERIAQLYQQGLLPLGQGAAAEALRRYALAGNRLSSAERAYLYVRVLGARAVPGGSEGANESGTDSRRELNRDFLSLWLRFLVSVAMYSRQRGVQDLLVPRTPANADVRRAARRLAANASLHGWGMAHFAARLTTEVERLISLLGDPEIERSFGARDMWSVVDQVNRLYLEGAVNVARYRTQAQAGRVVLQWLAANADRLGSTDATTPGGTQGGGASPTNEDLANATEQWLGASGVADELIDEYSQPGESPTLICPPVDLPAIAQDLLGAVGLIASGLSGSDAAERLRGVVALFHGAAGTGKTLAAHVLAAALSRDIVRVDLSRVVSRYIGETEKNLDAIFAQAKRTGAVLFIDEADALFGRRTEVKDSHDRYANLDVAALLQRIEACEGVVVLASNLAPKSDDAQPDHTVSDNDGRRRPVVRFPRLRHRKT